MFASRKFVDVFVGREFAFPVLSTLQVAGHQFSINAIFEAQIDTGVTFGVKHVVALILGVIHSEMLADVGGEWMDLEGKISTSDRVQEIEADRKLGTKTRGDRVAQQLFRMFEHQIDCGNLNPQISE